MGHRGDTATAVVSPQGIVTGWSEGARRLLGYGAAEVVGRAVTAVLAVDTAQAAWGAVAGARAWDGKAAVRHRDGRRLDLEMGVCPSLDGEGKADGAVLAVTAPDPDHNRTTLEWSFNQSSVAMILFDTELRYRRINDLAGEVLGDDGVRLLGQPFEESVAEGRSSWNYLDHLRQVVETEEPTQCENYNGEQAWNVEMWPVRDPSDDRLRAVAAAAFDNSEEHRARELLALLNEAVASIGTALDVVRTARELVELAVPRLADFGSVDLLDSVLQGEEPSEERIDATTVLRRVAHKSAVEGEPEPVVDLGEVDAYPPYTPPARSLATGRALLSGLGDPDFVRWLENDESRRAGALRGGFHSMMAVPLCARGLTLGVAVFARRTGTEPFRPDDLVLAEELARRDAVCVDNARRYAHERSTALALQRSLLPRTLPGQAAVEAAFRYLPTDSRAGVGGDWFDVVPLSGTRVALVVGDVAGHGIRASATMASLRTAVRTLADVDLPPDELLTHLDDLVIHLNADDIGGSGGSDERAAASPDAHGNADADEISATCLYALYNPVSRVCTLASAGHPPPTVLHPDGTVTTPEVTAGPPLGVGGLPFEVTELELPESSLLALYTDGLIETRERDPDTGLAQVRNAIASPAPSLEVTCDTLIKSLLPDGPTDDVALLLARTRALHTDQVATWSLPAEPQVVADARDQAARQLLAWGLEDVSFITELVVSELVTNAIRYGEAPIRLRLIRDRTLICEVSDGSSTAPHLRRARTFDEGGRGLLLVSQVTQGWGTRQTTRGKTIWAEQPLSASRT